MASQNIGSIHYDVDLKTGKFDAAAAGVNAKVAGIGDKFNGVAGVVSGFAKTAGVAMAAGAVAIGALTTKMLMAGAELEQQLGGAEAVFGEFASGIKEKAKDAYFTAGLSQAEFLQGANKMGSLFQGAGFSVQQSMNMSAESMQRASDIASIMGISTTEALEAVSGMAKGNFTMMDNLGVAMNDTAIGAYALSKGINKSTAEMSIQEKVGLAQQMFMEKTAKYAGNYAKENQTLAGSLNSTKKAFDNLMSGQGEVDQFIDMLLNTLKLAVPQIMIILPQIVEGLGAILQALIPALANAIPTMIPVFITAVVGLINTLVTTFATALPTLLPMLIQGVIDLFNALVNAFPVVVNALLAALPTIVDGFVRLFLAIVQALPKIVTTIAQAMPTIINALVNGLTNPAALTAIIVGMIQLLMALIQAIPIIIPALVNAIPIIIRNLVAVLTSSGSVSAIFGATIQLMRAIVNGTISSVGAIASGMWNIIRTIANILHPANLVNIGREMIQGLINGIMQNAGGVANKLKDIAKGALDQVKKMFGIKSPSRVMAQQGKYIMQGLGIGIDKGAKGVMSSITDAMTLVGNQLSGQQQIDMMMNAGSRGTLTAAGAGALGGQTAVNTYVYGDTILNGETDQRAYLDRLAQNFVKVSEGAAT